LDLLVSCIHPSCHIHFRRGAFPHVRAPSSFGRDGHDIGSNSSDNKGKVMASSSDQHNYITCILMVLSASILRYYKRLRDIYNCGVNLAASNDVAYILQISSRVI